MVKLKSLVVVLFVAIFAFSSESGVLSYRAKRSFDSGKFAKGFGQLERALLASRKEADLLSEGRILISMAQIRIMSLDLNFADSLLSMVRNEALDINTQVQFSATKISLKNSRMNYGESSKECSLFNKKLLDESDEYIQAAFYSECTIAYAGAKKENEANESLKMTGKRSDKKGGFYAYTAARKSDLLNLPEADSLYKIAEEKSIQNNKPYNTATILYWRSQLKTTSAKNAADLKLRCKNAFELMGLPNNAKRCQ